MKMIQYFKNLKCVGGVCLVFLSSSLCQAAPQISQLLKQDVYQRALNRREILTHASLNDVPGTDSELKKYQFYATMLVRTHPRRAHKVLTDYALYPKMIPYVELADYDAKNRRLKLRGGVLGFMLQSTLQFDEKEIGWIGFEIIEGHFQGMKGQVLFEGQGESGTLVYLSGSVVGKRWPPAWVVERGAEIVFGFTGQRMRSYLESPIKKGESVDDPEFPQPRSRLPSKQ